MTPMTIVPPIYLCGLNLGQNPFKIQMSAATAATPTAESVSEAKPTISGIVATKIQKLMPTVRIAVIRGV